VIDDNGRCPFFEDEVGASDSIEVAGEQTPDGDLGVLVHPFRLLLSREEAVHAFKESDLSLPRLDVEVDRGVVRGRGSLDGQRRVGGCLLQTPNDLIRWLTSALELSFGKKLERVQHLLHSISNREISALGSRRVDGNRDGFGLGH